MDSSEIGWLVVIMNQVEEMMVTNTKTLSCTNILGLWELSLT